MKKHLIISFVLITIICIQAKAQDSVKHYMGIKAGISIPNLTAGGSVQNELNSGYNSTVGPDFALFYECLLSKKISLSTQLEYSAQGGQKNGFQALPTPQELDPYFTVQQRPVPAVVYADFDSKAKIDYLMLSELAKFIMPFNSKSPLSFYIEAGPFAGLLISANQVTSGSSDIYADKGKQENISEITQQGPQSFDNTTDIKDQLHKGNFGIEGDVGFAFKLQNSKIFIEGGGNYSFLNIQKGTENGENHIGAGTVRVGYAFGIK
jgi:hypothetical protein